MVVPAVGEVVLVPFPFSELSQAKLRPAICIAEAGRGDHVLCQVTSNPYGDHHAVAIAAAGLVSGRLLVPSFMRPGKLFTAHQTLMVKSIGMLTPNATEQLIDAVVRLLKPTI